MVFAGLHKQVAELDGDRNDRRKVYRLPTKRELAAAHSRHVQPVFDKAGHVRGLPLNYARNPLLDGGVHSRGVQKMGHTGEAAQGTAKLVRDR